MLTFLSDELNVEREEALGTRLVVLLKSDTNKDFAEYLARYFLSSYDFLSHIILPTSVSDDISSTVIDNIFLNSIEYSIVSGNLTNSISDHFLQFLLLINASVNTALPTKKVVSSVHD